MLDWYKTHKTYVFLFLTIDIAFNNKNKEELLLIINFIVNFKLYVIMNINNNIVVINNEYDKYFLNHDSAK
jgi:hypothetical protein